MLPLLSHWRIYMADRIQHFSDSLSDQFKAAMAVENGEGMMLAYSSPGDGLPPHTVVIDTGLPGKRLVLTPEQARYLAAYIYELADKAEGK